MLRAGIRHDSEVLESLDDRIKIWESEEGLITAKAVQLKIGKL